MELKPILSFGSGDEAADLSDYIIGGAYSVTETPVYDESSTAAGYIDAEPTADRLGERYAFTPGKDGVVKFDGAMVDNAKPKIELKSDLSGFSTVYGDTAVEYLLEWDGDNVTLKDLPKEE